MIVVILVRHADVDLPPATIDPELNGAGRDRAQALANLARVAGVSALFTSSLIRTKQTVAPLAARLGIQPREVPTLSVLAHQVSSGSLGRMILIAGHSNTVPEMISALGVSSAPPVIGEREFDNLFVATIASAGDTDLLHLKYGAPS